jgi:hypothetical protein
MDIKPILEKMFPEGSIGPGTGAYQGQCFTFLHSLMEFPPVGDSLDDKKIALQRFGIPIFKLDGFRVGDVVLTNESRVNGHGGMINAIQGDYLRLSESNYHLDKKVHHTRLLSRKSPVILGVFRGKLKFKLDMNPQYIEQDGKIGLLFDFGQYSVIQWATDPAWGDQLTKHFTPQGDVLKIVKK